jgi:hypothetical protein
VDLLRARCLLAQGLTEPVANESDYVELFRRLQPVSPEANSYPGSPPRLHHRTAFDDAEMADDLRAERRLIKGRFHGGSVGYVYVDDLPLYAAAYRRPLRRPDARQEAVVRALTYAGPLSPRQLREETGLRHRPLMAAVHRLEQAFVVCEDQVDDAWDRPLHLVEREWPDLSTQMPGAAEAVDEVILRQLRVLAWATTQELVDGTGLGKRQVASSLQRLLETRRLRACQQPGAVAAEAWSTVDGDDVEPPAPPRTVRVLHLRDPLVRPQLGALGRRYDGREVLQYLLIDDRIAGAACGRWRIRPHDVEDVVVDDRGLAGSRRDEILAAVRDRYPPPERQVLAYDGEDLTRVGATGCG